jgi:site-specific DNA-methyltransferase (adenine-specific)
MDFMAGLPDKAFELAIVDPPYGIGMADRAPCGRLARYGSVKKADNAVPTLKYFFELSRVSKTQIIWGGNYFIDKLLPTRCFLIWDKQQPENVSFASCEFAWTNMDSSAKTVHAKS